MIKRNGYMIQRNSSGRDSTHAPTGNDDDAAAQFEHSSHIYSEPATEDPSAYLDPVRIRLDPDEEESYCWNDTSVMEGSVADTDYLDDFNKSLNVDKYKIRPPPPTLPLPAVPDTVETSSVDDQKMVSRSSSESLLRRKLIALGEESTDDYNEEASSSICSSSPPPSSASSSLLLNNLNKGEERRDAQQNTVESADLSSELSAPNIIKTPPPPPTVVAARVVSRRHGTATATTAATTLQRSLPSLCPVPTDSSSRSSASVSCDLDVVSSSCDNSPSIKPRC